MRNILIAGGSGFIGNNLTRALQSKGNKITLLTRHFNVSEKILQFIWNPMSGKLPENALDNQDVIINLAGSGIAQGRWTLKKRAAILNSRVESTRLLVKSIGELKNPPKLFINVSAIGYYGNRPGEKLTEESTVGTGFLSHVCEAWEKELLPLNDWSVRYVILRLGLVLSRNGGIFPWLVMPSKFYVKLIPGNGRQYISWIHLHDLIACTEDLIAGKLLPGVYNCVTPHAVTQIEFFSTIRQIMKHCMFSVRIPRYLLNLILGEMSTLLTDDQHALPSRLQEQHFTYRFGNLHDALVQLLNKNEK